MASSIKRDKVTNPLSYLWFNCLTVLESNVSSMTVSTVLKMPLKKLPPLPFQRSGTPDRTQVYRFSSRQLSQLVKIQLSKEHFENDEHGLPERCAKKICVANRKLHTKPQ